MIRVASHIPLKEGQLLWIAPFNDVHWNTEECDKERFRRYITWGVKELEKGNRIYGIGLGDYNDSLSPSERAALIAAKGGYGMHETTLKVFDEYIQAQADTFYDVIKPWKGHIGGLLDGHHYMCFSALAKGDLKSQSNTEYLADKLATVYVGRLGFFRLNLGHGLSFRILASHGYGGARTPGARVIKRVRMNEVFQADLYLMAHDNTKMAISDNVLEEVNGKYVARKRTYCGTGSFQRAYPDNEAHGGYVEEIMLPPSDLGATITYIRVEKRSNRWRLDWHTSV